MARRTVVGERQGWDAAGVARGVDPLAEIEAVRSQAARFVAILGNPNVGKSSLFGHLTGSEVITAHYAGTTVGLQLGLTVVDGQTIALGDLPGVYALGATSPDEAVVRRTVLEGRPDAVVVVVDAMNLARNLYLVLQAMDLGCRLVVALNQVDEAERAGVDVDAAVLSRELGVPVVATAATVGLGLDVVMRKVVELIGQAPWMPSEPRYSRDVDDAIREVSAFLSEVRDDLPLGLYPRSVAVQLLEGDAAIVQIVASMDSGEDILERAHEAALALERAHGEPAAAHLARERHGLAGVIADAASTTAKPRRSMLDGLWRLSVHPLFGIPVLLVVLGTIFVSLFYVGGLLSELVASSWATYVSPAIESVVSGLLGDSVWARILLWGPDAGLQSALSTAIPYVVIFYLFLAVLEDSGYLTSAAFLADRAMHRIGLHSQALIPLVAGAGCSVPAVVATRTLGSMRERFIANTLISLIPCSARTAVILGAVSLFVGWQATLFVFGFLGVIIVAVGFALNKVMPGESRGLVMEVFPLRFPSVGSVVRKTWLRVRDFVYVAIPVVFVGSLVLGALYETGAIWSLTAPLSPFVEGMLGLPPIAGLALIFAVVRKELALQLLVTLAVVRFGHGVDSLLQFMSSAQIVTYALVNALYIPCLATLPLLRRELGWKLTLGIVVITLSVASAAGVITRLGAGAFGWGQ